MASWTEASWSCLCLALPSALGGSGCGLPGEGGGLPDRTGACRSKLDIRAAGLPPGPFDRLVDIGLGSDQEALVLRREPDHGISLVGISQRGEDLPAHAEIRVAHVLGFRRVGQVEREPPKLVRGQADPLPSFSTSAVSGNALASPSRWARRLPPLLALAGGIPEMDGDVGH